MRSRLRDRTEFTHYRGRGPGPGMSDDTHRGSTLGTDPCRTSTKPSISNDKAMSRSAVCGVSVSSPTRNSASTNVRATRSQTSPAASIAIISNAIKNHQLALRPGRGTSHQCFGLRLAARGKHHCNNISDTSEARSSSHDLDRHCLDRRIESGKCVTTCVRHLWMAHGMHNACKNY